MSMLSEEVVEEWLNRNGYFTIRGIKIGNAEIDILAIKPLPDGTHECRHVEVQLSFNPISYFTVHNAKKRNEEEVMEGVREWIVKKFDQDKVVELREKLCSRPWTRELVLGKVKYRQEADACEQAGVKVWWLADILDKMEREKTVISSATGGDLLHLMLAGRQSSSSLSN